MNYQQLLVNSVEQWNEWRLQHADHQLDLSSVDLSHAYLFEANLSRTCLRGANLSRACLIGADLSQADLSGANLSGAYLSKANVVAANLHQAQLVGASLKDTNLSYANLSEVVVTEADLEDANLIGTCFASQAVATNPASVAVDDPVGQMTIASPVSNQTPKFMKQTSRRQNLVHTSIAWDPSFLKQCQRKLSDYYATPVAKLILADIVASHHPQTMAQFMDLVAAYRPALAKPALTKMVA